jgi:hypothetical protein
MAVSNPLLPGESHFISLSKAKEMTLRYSTEKNNILKPDLTNPNILLTSETFDREAFDKLLAQAGCVGIRVYFGMDANLTIKIIAVGVDEDNKDILPSPLTEAIEGGEENGGVIVEEGRPCPPNCPPDDGLLNQ